MPDPEKYWDTHEGKAGDVESKLPTAIELRNMDTIKVGDEVRLRTVPVPVIVKSFHAYNGDIIFCSEPHGVDENIATGSISQIDFIKQFRRDALEKVDKGGNNLEHKFVKRNKVTVMRTNNTMDAGWVIESFDERTGRANCAKEGVGRRAVTYLELMYCNQLVTQTDEDTEERDEESKESLLQHWKKKIFG